MGAFLADTTTFLERTPALLRILLHGLPSSWTDTPDVGGKAWPGILLRRDDPSAVPG